MAAAQVDQARKMKGSGGEEMMTRRVIKGRTPAVKVRASQRGMKK